MRPLDPKEQQELHTRGRLLVEEVSGPALAAGLQAGDVVVGVNGAGVSSVADLKREVARAGRTRCNGAPLREGRDWVRQVEWFWRARIGALGDFLKDEA